jgi:beta-glucosidase
MYACIEQSLSRIPCANLFCGQAGRRGGMRLGGRKKLVQTDEIDRAVQLAKESDGKCSTFAQSLALYEELIDTLLSVTVVIVGNSSEWESEAYDREDMKWAFPTFSRN